MLLKLQLKLFNEVEHGLVLGILLAVFVDSFSGVTAYIRPKSS